MSSFLQTFEKISLPAELMAVFSSASVEEIVVSKKEKKICICLRLSEIVPWAQIVSLQKELLRRLPGIRIVEVRPFFSLAKELPLQELLEESWPNIIHIIGETSPFCKGIIQGATWECKEQRLLIYVKHNASYYLIKRGLQETICNMLQEWTGHTVSVFFQDIRVTQEEAKAQQEEQNQRILELIQKIADQSPPPATASTSVPSTEILNGIVLGKSFSGTPIPIIDSKREGDRVILEGRCFSVTHRDIKGDRVIVTLDIADETDATTVKFFAKQDAFLAIEKVLKAGTYLRVQGDVQLDKYAKELNVMAKNIALATAPPERMDHAAEKRVELHLHTQMSSMDGITSVKEYINRAVAWGHKAIAITDHGVVQAFPDAMNAARGKDIRVLYGVEAYLIDDLGHVVQCPKGQTLDTTFVVFDIETTGLSKERDKITEIGAVKVQEGKIIDRFSSLVNPKRLLTAEITKLTGITDEMLADAPVIDTVLPQFLDFCQDSVLVAHNAGFDVGFIRAAAEGLHLPPVENTVLDTLELSRTLLPELKKHKLNLVAEHLGVSLENHHRAVQDAEATAEIFLQFLDQLAKKEILHLDQINVLASKTVNYNKLKARHAIILVKNQTGLRNLYELVSKSHIHYFYRRPRIPKSQFLQHREGLIIGSACEAGELYQALLDAEPKEYIDELVHFYDYLEIQPVGNNLFMIDSPRVGAVRSVEDIKNINRKIVALGEQHNKPVVATCDVHFIDPEDAVYRQIIMAAEGFADADRQPPLFFRTTDEMLAEFAYLGEEKAKEVVITNTNRIAEEIEDIKPIPDETFTPKIEGADEELTRITREKAISLYGDPLPAIVEERLERELGSIIKNGFSVLYIIAQKLVWKSVEDGYLVGSRGSVGSSFVANMAGITEVNSLPPHYVCPACHYSDFTSETVMAAVKREDSGCDMPDCDCPVCNTPMRKEGHGIPFETFLGFDGDKEPDIDLNFSGEYQQTAHAYTEELFGKGHVFKAGTIGTLADKTAYGFVKKYFDAKEQTVHNAQINRLVQGCTGIKRTTGQHPGGLMVVPSDHDIYEFCPIQRPANDMNSSIITTHFDYHSISGRLLKLDLLGHDDPTVIRMLYDLTGINPQTVRLDDAETMSLFESPRALGVTPEEIGCETGTLGIPEFGTKFVRQMLVDTKPKTFSDLLRISGLSHGTDVWIHNAQDLIAQGTITLKETISTRDSIMSYLINQGVDKKKSFKIMEKVRKGKGLTEEDISDMKASNVPDWYIESCQRIKYMFPKAHATAYVMMAFRIAYFKIHYPLAYYASYFTVRACDDFDYAQMCKGPEIARNALREIHAKGMEATAKEKSRLTVLEIVLEFYARGFSFVPIHLYASDAKRFLIQDESLLPPFSALQGLGTTAAQSIVEGRKGGEFHTIEELKARTSLGKTLIELLSVEQVLAGIPETNQLTLF